MLFFSVMSQKTKSRRVCLCVREQDLTTPKLPIKKEGLSAEFLLHTHWSLKKWLWFAILSYGDVWTVGWACWTASNGAPHLSELIRCALWLHLCRGLWSVRRGWRDWAITLEGQGNRVTRDGSDRDKQAAKYSDWVSGGGVQWNCHLDKNIAVEWVKCTRK